MSGYLKKRILSFFGLMMIISSSVSFAKDCSEDFNRILKTVTSHTQSDQHEIKTLDELLDGFTNGLQPDLSNPEQQKAFEVYRKMRFGDPNTNLKNDTMDRLVNEFKNHPDLKKDPFRNFQLIIEEKKFPVTDELKSFIDSQIKSSGQVRSNLFNMEANKGYWKKVLQYESPQKFKITVEDKTARKLLAKEADEHFNQFFEKHISKQFKHYQKNPKIPIRDLASKLHEILVRERAAMRVAGKDTKPISQAITDLVHTVGYHDPLIQQNLKSADGLTRLSAYRKILDERDRFALELGYQDHFKQILKEGGISMPTGVASEKDLAQVVQRLEDQVKSNAVSVGGEVKAKTVRHLSLTESPFRSCLGGSDCSSNTYLTRALDPNYHYFTITDEAGMSSGHITVVLGEARDGVKMKKVAFIDKVQNVDHTDMPAMMEAVRRSVDEKGYTLALPESMGDHNGISNEDMTRFFIHSHIQTDASERILGFKPHAHEYRFPNEYSRAEMQLPVRPVSPLTPSKELNILPGKITQSWKSKNLNVTRLVESTVALKNGSIDDQIRYISSMRTFERYGLKADPEFAQTLKRWISDPEKPFNLRKQVLISEWMESNKNLSDLLGNFMPEERVNLIQNLMDTPRFKAKMLRSTKFDVPHLLYHVKSSKKIRGQLIQLYEPGYQNEIEKILEANDLSPYSMAGAIKSIKTSLNSNAVEFVLGSQRSASKSSIEPWIETTTATAFLKNTQGRSALARGLEYSLGGGLSEYNRFGEVLLQVGNSSWGVKEPLVKIYGEINALRKVSGESLQESAKKWLSQPEVDFESKARFLRVKVGNGEKDLFESYWQALPSRQRQAVQAEMEKGGNFGIFRKYAEKHKVESTLYQQGVPESFEYRPIITPEQAKKGGVKFKMGEGKDAVEVTLTRPFEMQSTPMTQLQATLLTGKNHSHFIDKGGSIHINGKEINLNARFPAEQYNYYDQNEIIRILNDNDPHWNYRRPTEAEWEYAARGGSKGKYSFGERHDEMMFHGWTAENSRGKTNAVANFRPNDFGLFDMHGNVSQMVEDYFGDLPKGAVVDYQGTKNGVFRVTKGSHFDEETEISGISNRGGVGSMSNDQNTIGFRLVREPK